MFDTTKGFEVLVNAVTGTAAVCLLLYNIPAPQRQQIRETAQDAVTEVATNTARTAQKFQSSTAEFFKNGQQSLVAIATGSAEGTRRPDGSFTVHYQGHTDPGNGVWNLGSFSYQHGAATPEEADRKQLARLQRQWQLSEAEARAHGIELDPFLVLAGIDLWNQAPLAGQDYIRNLLKCKEKQNPRIIALCARIESYKDPKTGRFDAPGLGNTWWKIRDDQLRRIQEIEAALQQQEQQHGKSR